MNTNSTAIWSSFCVGHYNPLNMIGAFGEQGIPVYVSKEDMRRLASKYISTAQSG